MHRSTWTDEEFRTAAAEVTSIRQLLMRLNLCATGGSYQTVHRNVKRLGISIDHWLGRGSSLGKKFAKPVDWTEVLVLDRRNGAKENVRKLREAMVASGIPEVCSAPGCGQLPIWNGKPLRLQVDHENGNPLDNRPGNPRFLCPNCHTQTSNYGALNLSRAKTEEVAKRRREASTRATGLPYIVDNLTCGTCSQPFVRKRQTGNVRAKRNFCSPECNTESKMRSDRKDIIESFRLTQNYSKTGRIFGISNTMVKKIVTKIEKSPAYHPE